MPAAEPSDAILVLTTLPDAGRAHELVRQLVEARLAACGTVVDRVTSVYRWQGRIEEAAEAQVILKTRKDCWADLEAAVRTAHPYEVPELIAVPIAAGLAAYLDWIETETTSVDGGGA